MSRDPLFQQLQSLSLQFGFTQSGGVDLDDPKFLSIHQKHFQKYQEWLNAGHAGDMHYLERGAKRRDTYTLHLSDAQSAFCVLEPYAANVSNENQAAPKIARYISGQDYHERVSQKLNAIMQVVSTHEPTLRYKVCVDTSAVMERTLAYASGLGWIGKNTMLLNKELGSFFFIGVVFLNQKLNAPLQPQPNLCGHCDRCLKQCPTQAFTKPQTLDSRKCISYLTLEKRGPVETSQHWSNWIAGCDVCQEVCPFNHKRMAHESAFAEQPSFTTWLEALSVDQPKFELKTKHTAMNRIKFENYERNVALSMTALKLEKKLSFEEENAGRTLISLKKESARLPAWRNFWSELQVIWSDQSKA